MPKTILRLTTADNVDVVAEVVGAYSLIKHNLGNLFRYELMLYVGGAELDDLADLIPQGSRMGPIKKVEVNGKKAVLVTFVHDD